MMDIYTPRDIVRSVMIAYIHRVKEEECVGPSVCEFFNVAPVKYCSRTYGMCQRCCDTLSFYISQSDTFNLDNYYQKQCHVVHNASSRKLERRCGHIIMMKPHLSPTCFEHICYICEDEAHKDLDRLVCLILCLQRVPCFKNLIPLISGFARPVFWSVCKGMHLRKFKVTRSKYDRSYEHKLKK